MWSFLIHATKPNASSHSTESIESWLKMWLAKELKIQPDAVDTHQSFVSYGLDSVTAVELIADLEGWLGYQLSPTLAWNYPSPKSLAQHLAKEKEKTLLSDDL